MREESYDVKVTMKLGSNCKKEEKYSWKVGYLDRESGSWIAKFSGFGKSLSDAWSSAQEKRNEITNKKDTKCLESDGMKKYLKLEVWIDENIDDAKECADEVISEMLGHCYCCDGTVKVEVIAKNENI